MPSEISHARKHTSGPWTITRTHAANGGFSIDHGAEPGRVKTIAAVMAGPDGVNDALVANAHLIVAAPDLLDACEKAKRYFQRFVSSGSEWRDIYDALDNAIAKAKGKYDEPA